MRDQVTRLRRLAVDVREASAAEEHALSLHPEPVDPGELARSAVEFARPSYQAKGVELSLTSTAAGLMIEADAARLQQVLGNLLANALRHTPPGGQVTVGIGATRAHTVRIEVADTGEGIPVDGGGDPGRPVGGDLHPVPPRGPVADQPRRQRRGLGAHDRPRDRRRPWGNPDGRKRGTWDGVHIHRHPAHPRLRYRCSSPSVDAAEARPPRFCAGNFIGPSSVLRSAYIRVADTAGYGTHWLCSHRPSPGCGHHRGLVGMPFLP